MSQCFCFDKENCKRDNIVYFKSACLNSGKDLLLCSVCKDYFFKYLIRCESCGKYCLHEKYSNFNCDRCFLSCRGLISKEPNPSELLQMENNLGKKRTGHKYHR